jgi:hypothetical protein
MTARQPLAFVVVVGVIFGLARYSFASNHYTAKQLDALEERVGSEFWIHALAGKIPLFLTAPAPNAAGFRPADNDSFEISELVGRTNKNPYYKVKFQSGKIAYLRPEVFNEEINATIVTSDPLAAEKLKSEQSAEAEKQRLEWIDAQAWPPAVKEAAIKKQPPPGLNGAEVRQVMGPPRRITKSGRSVKGRGTTQVNDERWYYADGTILVFQNNTLSRVDRYGGK